MSERERERERQPTDIPAVSEVTTNSGTGEGE